MNLQDLRKRRYKTIKAFAEAYGCGSQKASGILRGLYHMTLSKDEVKHLALVLGVDFVECADACDNTYAAFKNYKGDEWKHTPRTHKGIWERWRWEEALCFMAKQAAASGDWTEYRKHYLNYGRRQSSTAGSTVSSEIVAAFSALQLSTRATIQEVKHARNRLVRHYHPDTGGSHDAFIKFNNAYEIALQYAKANEC